MPQLLTKEDQAAIEKAVTEAESRTSAQVVVAVAARSGRYQRGADWFGLASALVAVAVAWWIWQEIGPSPEPWETGVRPALTLPWILLIFAVWFVIGAAMATRFPILSRPFITRDELTGSVRRSGFEAFHKLQIARTRRGTGLLIYISLLERTVWVCPDDGIAAKLGEKAWNPVCAIITEGFREGRHGPAIVQAVKKAGHMLAEQFPGDARDPNELSDAVRAFKPSDD